MTNFDFNKCDFHARPWRYNQKHFAGCFIPFYTTKGSRADSENCSKGGGGSNAWLNFPGGGGGGSEAYSCNFIT